MSIRYFDMNSIKKSIGFGKYSSKTVIWIMINCQDYFVWMLTNDNMHFSDYVLELFRAVSGKELTQNEIEELIEHYNHLEQGRVMRGESIFTERESAKVDNSESKLGSFISDNASNTDESNQDWIDIVFAYYNSGNMKKDTESKKILWTEKRIDKSSSAYISQVPNGNIVLWVNCNDEDKLLPQGDTFYFASSLQSGKYKIEATDKAMELLEIIKSNAVNGKYVLSGEDDNKLSTCNSFSASFGEKKISGSNDIEKKANQKVGGGKGRIKEYKDWLRKEGFVEKVISQYLIAIDKCIQFDKDRKAINFLQINDVEELKNYIKEKKTLGNSVVEKAMLKYYLSFFRNLP